MHLAIISRPTSRHLPETTLFRKFASLIFAVSLLAGCTATFTYNQLDWLIPWYVDGLVDLSRDQKKTLREQIEPLLQWHREEELARYIEILDQIEADLSDTVTAGQVRTWVDEIVAAAERVEETMMGVALDFGASMSDEQMKEFTESLWEQQLEYEEDFLPRSDEEYRQENFEYLADLMEKFVGRLKPAQLHRLREGSHPLRRFDTAWLEERKLWLRKLEPLLLRPDGWQESVKELYADRKTNRTPQYREIIEHNMSVITLAMADVLNQLSNKQREHAVNEIEDMRAKLRKLINSARAKAA